VSFIKKSAPPPECEEGDVFKARILDISKVTSQWKNDDGSIKEQLKFEIELENGYNALTWMPYYEHPGEKSSFGKLILKLVAATKQDVTNATDAIKALKEFGWIFVKVKSFREYEDETYPNFAVVSDKLPGTQQEIDAEKTTETTETLTTNTEGNDQKLKRLLTQFEDAIKFGLPLNMNDWTKTLLVEDRLFLLKNGLVENSKDDKTLYFFTEKAQQFFQK
jgi:hypothetical protein